jgi:transposase-like protein
MTVFYNLKSRGVKDVSVVCCDDLSGISNAIHSCFENVLVQKCVVHATRNAFNRVPMKYKAEIAHDIKKIYTASSLVQAKLKKDDLIAK